MSTTDEHHLEHLADRLDRWANLPGLPFLAVIDLRYAARVLRTEPPADDLER